MAGDNSSESSSDDSSSDVSSSTDSNDSSSSSDSSSDSDTDTRSSSSSSSSSEQDSESEQDKDSEESDGDNVGEQPDDSDKLNEEDIKLQMKRLHEEATRILASAAHMDTMVRKIQFKYNLEQKEKLAKEATSGLQEERRVSIATSMGGFRDDNDEAVHEKEIDVHFSEDEEGEQEDESEEEEGASVEEDERGGMFPVQRMIYTAADIYDNNDDDDEDGEYYYGESTRGSLSTSGTRQRRGRRTYTAQAASRHSNASRRRHYNTSTGTRRGGSRDPLDPVEKERLVQRAIHTLLGPQADDSGDD